MQQTKAQVELVKDINSSIDFSFGIEPERLVDFGGNVYFTAYDETNGSELWKSDGTEAGTAIFKDINLGANGSFPSDLFVFGGVLYFTAEDDTNGTELWKSDGTVAGTVMIKDINPGADGSAISSFVAFGSDFYFSANDGTSGRELWKSDGTEAGTVLVKDIRLGGDESVPQSLVVFGGVLYFNANDGINGEELWKSDGTEAGTVLVKDIALGSTAGRPQGSFPGGLFVLGSNLYFTAYTSVTGNELWKSDGTEAGTVMVKDIKSGSGSSNIFNFFIFGSDFYFSAEDNVNGYELWKSDGTEVGTVLVKDINPSGSSFSSNLTVLGSHLYFNANDGTNGSELWRTDGTEAGTVLFKDINLGADESSPDYLVVFGSNLYFSADDGTNGTEFWKSDGTEAGTVMVKDLNSGVDGSYFSDFVVVGSDLYFSADDDTNGQELWKSDGTEAGTIMLKNHFLLGGSSEINTPIAFNNNLYFSADNGINGNELWKSDGTEAGTVLVKDIYLGIDGNELYDELAVFGGDLYFSADNGTNGKELWKTDGTDAGTVLVKDIRLGVNSSAPDKLVVIGSDLYFTADNGTNGVELWKSDGTDAGTVLVKDINSSGSTSSFPSNLTVVGSDLYLTANNGTNGTELWKSDGTEAGTILVKDIASGSSSSGPSELVAIGSNLYFRANDGSTNGTELWKSDGTEAGTVLVKDIALGSGSGFPFNLVVVGSDLYFTADDGTNGRELWKSDGTDAGTVMVKDINLGANGSVAQSLVAVGSDLYLGADDGTNGYEIWKSDGTEAGTIMVKDINPGANGSFAFGFVVFEGNLYFNADDGTNGSELWKSDGTEAGTVLVQDINSGAAESFPVDLVVAGSNLYFVADDGTHGTELWKLSSVVPPSSSEINLIGSGISIPSGTTGTSTTNNTDFGQTVGTPISKSFSIQNTGTVTLTVSSIVSSNASFVISNAPSSVVTSGEETFTVTFTPTVSGIQTSTITINNSDSDEATYTYVVTGEAVCPTTSPTISASTTPILSNQIGSIAVESQLGVTYQLQNVSNGNANVGNPVAGTGDTIYLPTNLLTTSTNFRVEAIRGLDCGNEILNTVTINVSTTLTGYGYEQTQINACTPSSSIADIDVSLTGSTYVWSNSTSLQDLTDVTDGIYSLTIDGTTTLPVIVGSPVEWDNPIRSIITNEGRVKANGIYNWNSEAAATSNAKLASGENGGFTFVVEDMTTIGNSMIGFATPNNVASHKSIDNAFYIAPSGGLQAYANNSYNLTTATISVGDRITILREGSSINYYHNAELVYTDTQTANATKELVVDIALTEGTSPQVWFSKCNTTFEVNYVQNAADACSTTAGEGQITLSLQGGTAPYTYNWANGATAIANPTGMQTGLTSVQVTDINSHQKTLPVIIGNPVNWTSLQNATVTQGQLLALGASNFSNTGAISTSGIGANTDGGITYIYTPNQGDYMIGLSAQNTDPNWTSLDYSVYVNENTLYMYEGISLVSSREITSQDRISIIRVGSELIYYKNSKELHRLTVDPTVGLFADIALASGQTPVIYTSWCPPALGLTYTLTTADDCATGTGEGEVSLQGTGGTTYTYTWNDANTDNPRTGLSRGLYEVTVTSGTSNFVSPLIVGSSANWADLANGATQTNGTITSPVSTGWTTDPRGGFSTNRLAASTNGGISFVITDLAQTENYQIGLSSITATESNWQTIGYSVWIGGNNIIQFFESGVSHGGTEVVTTGDKISIIRKAGSIEYYLNSELIRTVGGGTITQELAADVAIVAGTSPVVYASFCNPGFRVPNKVQANQTTIENGLEEDTFSIYPNPSTGIFNVRFATQLSENTQVTIFDGIGRNIKTQTFEKGSQKFSIDLKNQPKGVYLIHFNQNGATYSKSIIIE